MCWFFICIQAQSSRDTMADIDTLVLKTFRLSNLAAVTEDDNILLSIIQISNTYILSGIIQMNSLQLIWLSGG